MTRTAMIEFLGALRAAGQREAVRAAEFLNGIVLIDDAPSARAMALRETKAVGAADRIIFGTADRLGIQTITTDAKFVRGASAKGVSFSASLHPSAPLAGM